MVLETRRTILRPFVEADAPDVFAFAGDPRVGPAAGWRPHGSVEELRRLAGIDAQSVAEAISGSISR